MTEEDESVDDQLIGLLNDPSSHSSPSNFFEREPSSKDDSTTVRKMNFLLRSIVDQLRTPIDLEAESIQKWLIYKQAGPHRHQKFFGFFRQIQRFLKRFNEMTLVKKLNGVLKKAENCGDNMYRLDESAIRYMGCAYLRRLFLLDQIRESCVKCADGVLGLLEIDQWTNLCLVVFSLCAQIHSEAVSQFLAMGNVYKSGVAIFRNVDLRFPSDLNDLKVVQKFKRESKMFDDRKMEKSNLTEISRLLKYSSKRIEEAQEENTLRMKTTELITATLTTELTEIPSSSSKIVEKEKVQLDMSDLGISISREEMSFLNSTAISDDKSEADDSLFSPNLFGSKKVLKIKKKKRKLETTEKIPNFLSSTMDLLNEGSGGKSKKKKKKKN